VLHKIGNIPLKMKIICLSDAAISRTESWNTQFMGEETREINNR
jgi:hypothetical protein